jgi:hypothetical protein
MHRINDLFILVISDSEDFMIDDIVNARNSFMKNGFQPMHPMHNEQKALQYLNKCRRRSANGYDGYDKRPSLISPNDGTMYQLVIELFKKWLPT